MLAEVTEPSGWPTQAQLWLEWGKFEADAPSRRRTLTGCVLDVVIQRELERMRTKANRVDFLRAFVIDVGA